MPEELRASIAEAKETEDRQRAPLRLMTQFLRAVSESRMENALALAQTILKFEPGNAIILDYQATLAQYINNARELESACEGGSDGGHDNESSGDEGSSETATGPEDEDSEVSTEEASGDETPEDDSEKKAMGAGSDEKELQHLGGVLRQLRATRAAETREVASRWDEEKFAASRREVEDVLWKFLPDEAKQAAEKRAEEDASSSRRQSRTHKE